MYQAIVAVSAKCISYILWNWEIIEAVVGKFSEKAEMIKTADVWNYHLTSLVQVLQCPWIAIDVWIFISFRTLKRYVKITNLYRNWSLAILKWKVVIYPLLTIQTNEWSQNSINSSRILKFSNPEMMMVPSFLFLLSPWGFFNGDHRKVLNKFLFYFLNISLALEDDVVSFDRFRLSYYPITGFQKVISIVFYMLIWNLFIL